MTESLMKLQKVQIDILDIIDRICRENNLNYSLYAGTMLGAVRHHGFIPWDDDLDVCMPRKDYDQFLAIWPSLDQEGYVLLNKDISSGFSQSFSKIRKDHTTFLQETDIGGGYHTGIFVDIFPVDRMPVGKISRLTFLWKWMRYQLYMREFVPPKGNALIRLISKMMLAATTEESRREYRHHFEAYLRNLDENNALPVIFAETPGSMKKTYPADTLDQYVDMKFGEKEYKCFSSWDKVLRIKYNDYMQLPPEAERVWKHHPLVLDFEHNYDELDQHTGTKR